METGDKSNLRGAGLSLRARNRTTVMGAHRVSSLRQDDHEQSDQKDADLFGAPDLPAEDLSDKTLDGGSVFDEVFGEEPEIFESAPEEIAPLAASDEEVVDTPTVDASELQNIAEEKQGKILRGARASSEIPADSFDPIQEDNFAGDVVSVVEESTDVLDRLEEEPRKVAPAATQRREAASLDRVYWRDASPLAGFLVSFDLDPLGTFIELRSGRLLVSSEPLPTGNCLVIEDPSVSSMHAIVKVSSGGQLDVLDQLSESGTRIIRGHDGREESLSGERGAVAHGDVVAFGARKFHVCLLPRSDANQR